MSLGFPENHEPNSVTWSKVDDSEITQGHQVCKKS
jgi:hypothetical protein